MAVFTLELATDITFPNITIYRILCDGEFDGYRVFSNEGYVMYDTAANDVEAMIDPETGEVVFDPETGDIIEIPVIYYYTRMDCPKTYNFDNFTWVAVLRSTVDEDHIYGDNNHETI